MRWALAVMLITCLPYLYAARCAPPGTSFLGLMFVADDHCVYLAWEQQAAQGHFLLRNLFTGDPQRGIYIHLLCWLIGTVSRLTGLPLILAHHGARVIAGAGLLILLYALFARFTPDVAIRRAAFSFAALSAGFGCLFAGKGINEPFCSVDLWQPEAITFLCLYVNGLFCVALAAMVGILLLLLGAEEREGWPRWGRVLGAGLLGLLLGNIHSYDILTLAAVWGIYLAARTLESRASRVTGLESPTGDPRPATRDPRHRSLGRALANLLVVGLVALPSTLYQYYLYRTEPVFRMRAQTQTLTPSVLYYLEGYGLVFILALGGLIWLVSTARRRGEPLGERLLPVVWAIVGFVLPYLPVSFQRKLAMGLHIPLAFLAAVCAVALAQWVTSRGSRVASQRPGASHLVTRDPRPATAVLAGLLLLTMPSNWGFIRRDIAQAARRNEDLNRLQVYVPNADLAAMRWARGHLAPDGVIFCSTVSGRLFPALAGRPAYVGHWSESPRANERLFETLAFFRATDASSEERYRFLAERGIRYLYLGSSERDSGAAEIAGDACLRPIYRNEGAVLYELQPRQTASAGTTVPATAASANLPGRPTRSF
jgi:hypothetical protein